MKSPHLPASLVQIMLSYLVFASVQSRASIDGFSVEEELIKNPRIMTSVRLSQKPKDVPAVVTAITAETIRDLGISSLPEVMRLVPGISMTQAS